MDEQKKADDLGEQLNADAQPGVEAEGKGTEETDVSAAATPDVEAEKVADAVKPKPVGPAKIKRGVFGSLKEPKFKSVDEALSDRIQQLEKRLRINEDLMLTYLFREEINETYYIMWRSDANRYFRNICTSKVRLARLRKSQSKAS